MDLEGVTHEYEFEGFEATVFCHENDHLDGILFIDRIKDEPKAFYKMNDKGDLDPVDYDQEIKDNKELFPDE